MVEPVEPPVVEIGTTPRPGSARGKMSGVVSTLRLLLIAFTGGIVALSVVTVIVARDVAADGPAAVAVAVVVAAGLASLALRRVVANRLDGTSDAALMDSYRTRFLMRLALGEAPALIGFAVALALGPWWVFFAALPFTALSFALAAPTVGNVARDQAALRAEGCHRPLGQLLGLPSGPFA